MTAQSYDPFRRGRFAVGVRTLEIDATLARGLPTELWYPAADEERGRDLERATRDAYAMFPGAPLAWQAAVRDGTPRAGRFPTVVFSHGFGGHRRQSTFLCTHLASHGYIVAAPDHRGNTGFELMQRTTAAGFDRAAAFRDTIRDRPGDISAVIDALFAELAVDRERIAIIGHSFGGWTALRAIAGEPRIGVAALLAPAGGHSSLRQLIDFGWERLVPTVVIAGDRDTILPIDGIRSMYDEIRAPKKLVVIHGADHLHFVDQAERMHEFVRAMPVRFVEPVTDMVSFSELIPAEPAAAVIRGLTLAHLDAFLTDNQDANSLLSGDLVALCATHGAAVDVS